MSPESVRLAGVPPRRAERRAGGRVFVLLVGLEGEAAALSGLAGGEHAVAAVADGAAAARVLAAERVDVVCVGSGLAGVPARDFIAAVTREPGDSAPPIALVLAGGPDLTIFQELIDESRLFYLSQVPPAPHELDALLRTAVRRVPRSAAEGPAAEEAGGIPAQSLIELLRRLALLDDPEEMAELAAETARELLGADRAYCLLFDAAQEELWAPGLGKMSRRRESAAVGLVSFVLRSGLPVRVPRLAADPRYDRSADDPAGSGDERFAAVPISAAGRDLGVLAVVRGADGEEFSPRELEDLEELAAQVAPYLAAQLLADADGAALRAIGAELDIFRPEVVERSLRPQVHADPLRLSPSWTRWTYWLLLAALAGFLVYAWAGRIDEYASGLAVVETGGRSELTARVAGTLVGIDVAPGQRVTAGQVVARFDDSRERADLERSERELTAQLINRLRDPANTAAEQALITLRAEREQARARVAERLLRAPAAGSIGDVLVRPGQYLEPGQAVLSLAAGDAEPSVTAVLPGHFRPLLRPGLPIRLEISGYRYAYQQLVVAAVGDEVIGPAEAARTLGPALAGAVQLSGPVILVKARLPARTFRAEGKTYGYHNGMQGTAEVRVRSERLLWTLLPGLKATFAGNAGTGRP